MSSVAAEVGPKGIRINCVCPGRAFPFPLPQTRWNRIPAQSTALTDYKKLDPFDGRTQRSRLRCSRVSRQRVTSQRATSSERASRTRWRTQFCTSRATRARTSAERRSRSTEAGASGAEGAHAPSENSKRGTRRSIRPLRGSYLRGAMRE